ncbi:hypothetical protein RHSIM_Rhsim12G0184800 [Rhododendron simsii]|uniref:Retrotransposon gag domain-containing protein n=1 Tax=Rhododendron simsii TaxID=118357 RepID=A0A834G4L7_RHOSS|nr:hypothetical protein RHSIM_Rhsim12G0184800 [Rhododendron simsii]
MARNSLGPEMIKLLPNFYGFSNENPYLHIQQFEEICATLSNLDIEAVKIQFFEHSLQYEAAGWFFNLKSSSKTKWQEVKKLFLEKFSLVHEMAHKIFLRKQEIVHFTQTEEESYLHYWERYNDLLSSFPCNGFEFWHIIEFFYEGMNCKTRQFVDMMCHGEFLDRADEKGWAYYNQLAKINAEFWDCNKNIGDVNSHITKEEPIVTSEGDDLGLEEVLESELNNELKTQSFPQEDFTCPSDITCPSDTLPTMLDAADDLDRLKRYLVGDTTATFASTLGISSSTVGNH